MPRSGEIPSPSQNSIGPKEILTATEPAVSETPADRGDETQGKLISKVSSLSGLDRREVVRRAQRKRRALGPVSMQVAVLLLAREQNLEMDELSQVFN